MANGKITVVEIVVCSGAFVSLLILKYFLQRSDKQEEERPKFHSNTKKRDDTERHGAPSPSRYDYFHSSPSGEPISNSLPSSSWNNEEMLSSDGLSSAQFFPVLGLANLGNTCYVNSLVQALACLPQFAEWLLRTRKLVCSPPRRGMLYSYSAVNLEGSQTTQKFTRVPISKEEARNRRFLHSFCELVDVLNGRLRGQTRDACYTATELISSVFGGSEFSHYQQDPDELFLFVIHLLIKTASAQSPSILDLPFLQKETSKTGALLTEFGPEFSPLMNGARSGWNIPFQGLFHQDLLCVVCKRPRPQPLEVFHSLSLSFPFAAHYPHNAFLLENLIQSFFVPADLDSVECPYCSDAASGETARTPHLKRISIAKFPKILCVHIRRAVWSDSDNWKRPDLVSFPPNLVLGHYSWLKHIGGDGISKTMDFPSRISEHTPIPSAKLAGCYSLKSVIVHVGHSSVGGHIVTYRKGPVGKRNAHEWYLTSDEFVKRLSSWREVELANPYMLFYELITS